MLLSLPTGKIEEGKEFSERIAVICNTREQFQRWLLENKVPYQDIINGTSKYVCVIKLDHCRGTRFTDYIDIAYYDKKWERKIDDVRHEIHMRVERYKNN